MAVRGFLIPSYSFGFKEGGPGKSTALLSAFRIVLSAPMLHKRVTSRRGGAESGRKAESPLTLVESRAVGLPWP